MNQRDCSSANIGLVSVVVSDTFWLFAAIDVWAKSAFWGEGTAVS